MIYSTKIEIFIKNWKYPLESLCFTEHNLKITCQFDLNVKKKNVNNFRMILYVMLNQ